MAGSAFGLPQIASLYDPSVAVDQAALERQMAIAQMLRQQAMTPVDTSGRQIGGMGYRVSPMEGVAKMVQALMANRQDTANDAARLKLTQQMAAALQQGLGQQPQQTPQAAQSGQPQMSTPENPQLSVPPPQGAPQQPQSRGMTLADLVRGGMTEAVGGSAMAAANAKQFEPTDFARALRSAGVDPDSAIGRKLQQDQIAKQNYIPPASIRPGGGSIDPITGKVMVLPQSPPGFVATQDPNSPTGFNTVPQPGGTQAVQASRKAEAAGAAGAEPYPTVDVSGRPQPLESKAKVLGLEGGQIPPPVQAQRDDKRAQILAAELRKETDPQNRKAIQTELDNLGGGTATIPKSGSYAAPPLGTEAAQKGLDTSWEQLKAQSREASNTKSYLQNIVTAAEKGAIVGPGADRREMIQGFLQLAGIKEAVNTNATTQTQLLDKYHDQIVTRLGQGGLGTDAARALLDSAYPGKHMNVDAIREAAGNLGGAQEMVQAKTRFLLDPATKRDSTEYQKREIQFDQNADPRIWQYKNIRDPNARKEFAKQLQQQDPTIVDRMRKLEELGAL